MSLFSALRRRYGGRRIGHAEGRPTEMLKGKWSKTDGKFTADIRVGGRGQEHVGQQAALLSANKTWSIVTLGDVVKDYGPGDVVVYRVVR